MNEDKEEGYWYCSFCGSIIDGVFIHDTKNEGTTSVCKKCGGVRKTA